MQAAVDALTRNLGLEWGHFGIRTAGVAPGPIEGTAGMTKLAPSPDAAAQVGALPCHLAGACRPAAWLATGVMSTWLAGLKLLYCAATMCVHLWELPKC